MDERIQLLLEIEPASVDEQEDWATPMACLSCEGFMKRGGELTRRPPTHHLQAKHEDFDDLAEKVMVAAAASMTCAALLPLLLLI